MNDLQTAISSEETKIAEALQKAKNELLVVHRYSLSERGMRVPAELSERLELKTEKEAAPECFDFSKSTRSATQEESSSASLQNRKESLQKMDLVRKSLTKLYCRRKVVRTAEKSTASEKKENAFLLCLTSLRQKQLTL